MNWIRPMKILVWQLGLNPNDKNIVGQKEVLDQLLK